MSRPRPICCSRPVPVTDRPGSRSSSAMHDSCDRSPRSSGSRNPTPRTSRRTPGCDSSRTAGRSAIPRSSVPGSRPPRDARRPRSCAGPVRRWRSESAGAGVATGDPSPEDVVVAAETAAAVRRAAGELNDRQRLLVNALFYQSPVISYDEVSRRGIRGAWPPGIGAEAIPAPRSPRTPRPERLGRRAAAATAAPRWCGDRNRRCGRPIDRGPSSTAAVTGCVTLCRREARSGHRRGAVRSARRPPARRRAG